MTTAAVTIAYVSVSQSVRRKLRHDKFSAICNNGKQYLLSARKLQGARKCSQSSTSIRWLIFTLTNGEILLLSSLPLFYKAREVGWVSQNNIVQKNTTGLESRLPVSRICICIYCEVIPQKKSCALFFFQPGICFLLLGSYSLNLRARVCKERTVC